MNFDFLIRSKWYFYYITRKCLIRIVQHRKRSREWLPGCIFVRARPAYKRGTQIGLRDRKIRKRGKRVPVVSPAAEIASSFLNALRLVDTWRDYPTQTVIVVLYLSRSVAFHPVRFGLARKLNKWWKSTGTESGESKLNKRGT